MHRGGKWCTSAAIRDYLGKPFLIGGQFREQFAREGKGIKKVRGETGVANLRG